MTAFLSELRKVVFDLNEVGLPWCLIGGLACSVYCDPRTTKDIDVAILSSSPKELEEVILKLEKKGYFNRQILMHMQPTHRLGWRLYLKSSRGYEIPVDLLSTSSGIESEVVSSAQVIEILPSLHLPVACRGHLIAMKVISENASDRIRDRIDLQGLLSSASEEEINDAKVALALATKRGFNRGKDLLSVLNELVSVEE
jgi:hypothetical protein